MPYQAEISRTNPTCLLFLVDQSKSMEDPFGGEPGKSKAEEVADAINRLLQTLILRCSKSDGIRDYFHIGVIGYGAAVGPALGGTLAGRDVASVGELANHPLRVESRVRMVPDGAGGLVPDTTKFPVWFEPVASGATPMCQALELAIRWLAEFLPHAPAAFPPIVFNLTDGEATDGDPESLAEVIHQMGTSDGAVLLFNLHLSSDKARSIHFPSSEDVLPNESARLLFRMSSPLPVPWLPGVRHAGYRADPGSRGFVFNADLVSVIQFLDIGTQMKRNLR